MKLVNGIFQIVVIKMGVYLGSQNGLMAQHLLYGSQVGSTINQMRCKGVSERVGTYLFL